MMLTPKGHGSKPDRVRARPLSGLDRPVLGACLDTSNSLAALETPGIVSDALAPHALCLHIRGFRFVRVDYGLGYLVHGCPIGEGQLEIRKIIEHVRLNSRLKSMVLEQWTPYQGSVDETVLLQGTVKETIAKAAEWYRLKRTTGSPA